MATQNQSYLDVRLELVNLWLLHLDQMLNKNCRFKTQSQSKPDTKKKYHNLLKKNEDRHETHYFDVKFKQLSKIGTKNQ